MVGQLTERYFSGEFLYRELYGVSRGIVTFDNTAGALDLLVESGTVFAYGLPGTVVQAAAGNTGNGTISNVQTNLIVEQLGTWNVAFTSPTAFTVTAPDGTVLPAGTVGTAYLDGIGFQLNAGGTAFVAGDAFSIVIANGAAPVVTAKAGGNTGNGTITNVEVVQQATASTGNYIVTFTGATAYTVTDPKGVQLLPGTNAKYYEDRIGFQVTAGGTAFANGDSFTIGVGTGSGYVTAFNGSTPAAGIIYNTDYVPAGGTAQFTSIERSAEVGINELRFPIGASAGERATAFAQLKTLGIIAR